MSPNTTWEERQKRKRIAADGERVTVTMAMMDDAQRAALRSLEGARHRPGFLSSASSGAGQVIDDELEAEADAAWDAQTEFLRDAWKSPPMGAPSFLHTDARGSPGLAPKASASSWPSTGAEAGAEGDVRAAADAAWEAQGERLREAWRGPSSASGRRT